MPPISGHVAISAQWPSASAHCNVALEKAFNVTAGASPEQREENAEREAPRQNGANVPELGVTVTPQRRSNGAVVSNVDPDGPAADRRVNNGDVILEAGGKKVATAGELGNAIDAARKSGRHSVLLHVKSGNTMKFIAVPVGRGECVPEIRLRICGGGHYRLLALQKRFQALE
jgi:C-terminal processing protease CtpA/Prc